MSAYLKGEGVQELFTQGQTSVVQVLEMATPFWLRSHQIFLMYF